MALLVSACTSTTIRGTEVSLAVDEVDGFLADKPPGLRPLYERLLKEGTRNHALNAMELGLAHLQREELGLAAERFDDVLDIIERFYVDDENARKVRESWYAEEGAKDFKGEPYERVMAYYYRGLLYAVEGKLQQSRASFKAGVMQDAFAEEEQDICDTALLMYLQGVLSQWIGDEPTAAGAFAAAKMLRPDLETPATAPRTLVLVELGACPVKIVDGVSGQRLTYHRNLANREVDLLIEQGGEEVLPYPIEDVYWQASTRGGRMIDHILEGRAEFRESVSGAGLAFAKVGRTVADQAMVIDAYRQLGGLATGGSTAASSSLGNLADVGSAIGLVSGLAALSGGAVQARADDRHWRNLPNTIQVATFDRDVGLDDLELEFLDEDGAPVHCSEAFVRRWETPHGHTLIWIRSRTAQLQPHTKR